MAHDEPKVSKRSVAMLTFYRIGGLLWKKVVSNDHKRFKKMGMYPKGTKKFFHEYTISVEDMGPLVSELKKIFPQIIKIDLPEDKNMDCYLLDPDPPDEKEITKRITLYVAMTKPHGGHCIVGYDDFDEGIKLRNEGLLFGMYAGEYSPLYHLRHTLAIKGITAVSLPVQENEMMPDLLALPVGLKYELQFR